MPRMHCVECAGHLHRTEITPLWGDISPFHIACSQYLSRHTVFAPKNLKRKKWFRAKTMDDLEIPGARLY